MKGIRGIILEITFIVIFIIVTGFWWNGASKKFTYSADALKALSGNLEMSEKGNYDLSYPVSEKSAIEKFVQDRYLVKNNMSRSGVLEFQFLYRKDSTLDAKYIKCMVFDTVYSLSDLYDYEDSEYVYYKLHMLELDSNSSDIVPFMAFIDGETSGNEVMNKTLAYTFNVKVNDLFVIK